MLRIYVVCPSPGRCRKCPRTQEDALYPPDIIPDFSDLIFVGLLLLLVYIIGAEYLSLVAVRHGVQLIAESIQESLDILRVGALLLVVVCEPREGLGQL